MRLKSFIDVIYPMSKSEMEILYFAVDYTKLYGHMIVFLVRSPLLGCGPGHLEVSLGPIGWPFQ